MKKIITGVLTLSLLAGTLARAESPAFYCQDAYQHKLANISKHEDIRLIAMSLGEVGAFAVGWFATGGLISALIPASFLLLGGGLVSIVTLVPVAGAIGYGSASLLDTKTLLHPDSEFPLIEINREDGLREALKLALISQVSAKQIEQASKDAYIASETESRKADLRSLNAELEKLGKPPVSFEDYLAKNPIPDEDFQRSPNTLDQLLRDLGKNRTSSYDDDYENLRLFVVEKLKTDEFCPKGHPLTLKQIVKKLRKS